MNMKPLSLLFGLICLTQILSAQSIKYYKIGSPHKSELGIEMVLAELPGFMNITSDKESGRADRLLWVSEMLNENGMQNLEVFKEMFSNLWGVTLFVSSDSKPDYIRYKFIKEGVLHEVSLLQMEYCEKYEAPCYEIRVLLEKQE